MPCACRPPLERSSPTHHHLTAAQVDLMVKAGHPVLPVKPNAIKAWRKGKGAPAPTIADYPRLHARRLASAVPCSDQTRALHT
jgi:hypothetical protein